MPKKIKESLLKTFNEMEEENEQLASCPLDAQTKCTIAKVAKKSINLHDNQDDDDEDDDEFLEQNTDKMLEGYPADIRAYFRKMKRKLKSMNGRIDKLFSTNKDILKTLEEHELAVQEFNRMFVEVEGDEENQKEDVYLDKDYKDIASAYKGDTINYTGKICRNCQHSMYFYSADKGYPQWRCKQKNSVHHNKLMFGTDGCLYFDGYGPHTGNTYIEKIMVINIETNETKEWDLP